MVEDEGRLCPGHVVFPGERVRPPKAAKEPKNQRTAPPSYRCRRFAENCPNYGITMLISISNFQ